MTTEAKTNTLHETSGSNNRQKYKLNVTGGIGTIIKKSFVCKFNCNLI